MKRQLRSDSANNKRPKVDSRRVLRPVRCQNRAVEHPPKADKIGVLRHCRDQHQLIADLHQELIYQEEDNKRLRSENTRVLQLRQQYEPAKEHASKSPPKKAEVCSSEPSSQVDQEQQCSSRDPVTVPMFRKVSDPRKRRPSIRNGAAKAAASDLKAHFSDEYFYRIHAKKERDERLIVKRDMMRQKERLFRERIEQSKRMRVSLTGGKIEQPTEQKKPTEMVIEFFKKKLPKGVHRVA